MAFAQQTPPFDTPTNLPATFDCSLVYGNVKGDGFLAYLQTGLTIFTTSISSQATITSLVDDQGNAIFKTTTFANISGGTGFFVNIILNIFFS